MTVYTLCVAVLATFLMAIVSRLPIVQFLCLFSVLSIVSSMFFLFFGTYFLGYYFYTGFLLDTLCSGELAEIKSYNAISADMYYLDTYLRTQMCTESCPCKKNSFDKTTWLQAGFDISTNIFTGKYVDF